MTVFQHVSVVPTSELVGRELKGRTWKGGGGGGSGVTRDPPPPRGYPGLPLCEKLFFVPIMHVAKTRVSEESAPCLLLKDIVTDEQWN